MVVYGGSNGGNLGLPYTWVHHYNIILTCPSAQLPQTHRTGQYLHKSTTPCIKCQIVTKTLRHRNKVHGDYNSIILRCQTKTIQHFHWQTVEGWGWISAGFFRTQRSVRSSHFDGKSDIKEILANKQTHTHIELHKNFFKIMVIRQKMLSFETPSSILKSHLVTQDPHHLT